VKTHVLVALIALGGTSPLYGQVPEVGINRPFTVAADHNGVDTTGYRIYLDNSSTPAADIPVSQRVGGVITSPALTVTARGTHTVQVAAYNQDGEARSAALTFVAQGTPPTAPAGLRVQVVATVADSGKVDFTIVGLDWMPPPDATIAPSSPDSKR
jgi:hypothetical protein